MIEERVKDEKNDIMMGVICGEMKIEERNVVNEFKNFKK